MKEVFLARRFLASLGALFAFGCGGNVINVSGTEVYERYWNKAVEEIRPRASFELSCAADMLKFSLLRRERRTPVEVGVDGCGNRAVYTKPSARTPAGTIYGSWRLESSSKQGAD